MGIAIDENFDAPFSARNIKEFWNRWHITLSTYMRDMVFSPLSKFLASRLGARGLRVLTVRPGYMDTALTAQWDPRFRDAARAEAPSDPADVAARVVEAVRSGRGGDVA